MKVLFVFMFLTEALRVCAKSSVHIYVKAKSAQVGWVSLWKYASILLPCSFTHMEDCFHFEFTAGTIQKFRHLLQCTLGLLESFLTCFLLGFPSEGHPVLANFTIVSHFSTWWSSYLYSKAYKGVGNSFIPFSWLIAFNSEIPLML